MKRTRRAISIALICTSASFAIAQASAEQSVASSADPLDAFVGSGICAGGTMAMGKNPGHASMGKLHVEKTLDGHWVAIHYTEEPTAANPKPYSVVNYIGYDAAKKQYVSVAFDNSGSGYSTGTSPGWKGKTITFDQTMDGKHVAYRDIFTKGDAGMSSHTGMMKDKSGKWVKTDAETCHKA